MLEAVRRVLRAHGTGAPVRVLAQEAGVSTGVLYQRFGSKDQLLQAALTAAPPDVDGIERHRGEDSGAHVHRLGDIAFSHFVRVLPDALLAWTRGGDRPADPDGRGQVVRAFARALGDDEGADVLVALAHDLALAVVTDGLDRRTAQERLRVRCARLRLSPPA